MQCFLLSSYTKLVAYEEQRSYTKLVAYQEQR